MGRVAEFETQLRQNASAKFADWHAVDLHNHTPSSDDYRYKEADASDKLIQVIKQKNLSVVMFTDHERLPDADFTKKIADGTGRLILRGAELNVFVDVWNKPTGKVGKNLYFHLLVGFDPDGNHPPDYWLEHIRRECRESKRFSASHELNGLAAPVEDLFKIITEANGILIPAHLHSTHDAFKSRSIDDIFDDAEFLRHSKDHFTALEVKSEKTAAFFDGQHDETSKLARSCIRSSDSHEPNELGERPCYVQMQDVSYTHLKAALELPFRTSLHRPELPSNYIVGLHIDGLFLKDLWLLFSPNCNAFIGVKGSGKTSALESLRFVLGADVPESRAGSVKEHLTAILGSVGKVTALVKRSDGAKVLIERTMTDPRFRMTFEDGRDVWLDRPDALYFPSYILGWHEIEQAATDANIRRLYMDSIVGKEQVRTLTEEAESIAATIRTNHERTAHSYGVFRQLEGQVTRLKELRTGLQELTDANLIGLKNQYQSATEHKEALRTATAWLKQVEQNAKAHVDTLRVGLERESLNGDSPLREAMERAGQSLDHVVTTLRTAGEAIQEAGSNKLLELEAQQQRAANLFQQCAEEYSSKVSALSREDQQLLESHRRVLEETKTLPTVEAERDKARQDMDRLLREQIDLCTKLTNALDRRFNLRKTKVASFSEGLGPFDIRLSVIGYQPTPATNELSQRYTQGAGVFTDIRQKWSDRMFHLSLKRGYEDLLSNLLSGYAVFFDNSEVGYFIGVFEEDDLQVELKVGKSDQNFKPLSQLSAGQRCTAIFPVLLKQQSGPLVVDQPEDNLDNRHIAGVIGPVLLQDKRVRQVMFTSHNANLVVLSDPELIVACESDGVTGRTEEQGFLATPKSPITRHVVEILDGGEKAMELRRKKYGH